MKTCFLVPLIAILTVAMVLALLEKAALAAPVAAASQNAAWVQLTSDVREIAAPGAPGSVGVFGPDAFAVVAGKTGADARQSVVAAASSGKTRIVAWGHDGYLSAENLAFADTGKFFDNALAWAAGNRKPQRVGVLSNNNDVLSRLQAQKIEAAAVKNGDFAPFSVLIINGHALKAQDLLPLQSFLARGGGLLIATTGWGWNYNTPALNLARDFVGNQLLAPYGLVWIMATLDKTTSNGFKVEAPPPFINASQSLSLLEAKTPLSLAQSIQISNTLSNLMTGLPATDTLILPQLKRLANGATGDIVPSARRPLKADNPTARLILTVQSNLWKTLPVEEVRAHPAGEIFPGDVPPNAKAQTKTFVLDTSIPDWRSLGLYAAPGAPITVTLPGAALPKGLSVRIGSHTDTLYNADIWRRAPEISRLFALKAGANKVANPFGGLVYLVVPANATPEKISVTISGAYAAPLYVEGQTSLRDWQNSLRWAPAPWAEIATEKIILTVPSRAIRDLDDPAPLCAFYNRAMDAIADLAAIPRQRPRPERIVADVQISAGYMHSGYPIMTWLDVEKTTVDLAALSRFPWGHFHEIGHNHQQAAWTFEGTGEVTNNLFALYVWNTVLGRDLDSGHPALSPTEWAKRWAKYNAGGRRFKDWQSDPFLALEMYIQLQKSFGWQPFKTVFAQYRTLTEAQKPRNEQEKRDQWMTRMSRATGKNLGPFFQFWGVPTSAIAREALKDLPAWMPAFPAAP